MADRTKEQCLHQWAAIGEPGDPRICLKCGENDVPTSKTVLEQLEAWIASNGSEYVCTRQYPHPGYASDHLPKCAGCLIVRAALELKRPAVETTDRNAGPMPAHLKNVMNCLVLKDDETFRVQVRDGDGEQFWYSLARLFEGDLAPSIVGADRDKLIAVRDEEYEKWWKVATWVRGPGPDLKETFRAGWAARDSIVETDARPYAVGPTNQNPWPPGAPLSHSYETGYRHGQEDLRAEEPFARQPGDCKHERAAVKCPDCGIDFIGTLKQPEKATAPHVHAWEQDRIYGGAICKCGARADGWYCPDSPDHVCHYEKGDFDQCDHCGQPEERK